MKKRLRTYRSKFVIFGSKFIKPFGINDTYVTYWILQNLRKNNPAMQLNNTGSGKLIPACWFSLTCQKQIPCKEVEKLPIRKLSSVQDSWASINLEMMFAPNGDIVTWRVISGGLRKKAFHKTTNYRGTRSFKAISNQHLRRLPEM